MSWIATLTSRRSGRAFVVLVLLLLPFVCFVPWILVTGPADLGHRLGILSEFKLQTLIDPKPLGSETGKDAAQAKPADIDLLLTREAANRLNSLAATALLVFVAFGAGVYGWMVAWRLSAKLGDRSLFALAGLIAIILLKMVWPDSYHRVYDLLGNQVFQSTIGAIYGGRPLAVLDHQQIVNNFVLVIAGVGLAFAAALIAVLASRVDSASDLSVYIELKRHLDRILLGSALMLAAGVIDLKQWTALPVPFMADPGLATAYTSFVGGFVSLQSICYVAGLIMMFLPAAWLLNGARERMVLNVPPEKAAAEVPPGGFAVTDLLRVAAMLAPILVGPVANLVNLKAGF
jgi:hypothetical protein